jgi:hypothetical protein
MQGALNAGKSITCHGISFVTEGENSTYYGWKPVNLVAF